jgi:EAL domain-containing protein (putative c-di-GMP-specific phosphodiesterase class I)
VTVNRGRRQLQDPGLVEDVRTALAAAGLEPRRLVLEVPEGALVADREHTLRVLATLKGLGVRLSVDDFGTRYASLSCLRAFPVDVLKVSRTFVARLTEPGDGPALAHAILSIGRTLRLRTVAEGVESVHQARELLRMGCEQGQGYLFAPALAPDVFEAYLKASSTGPAEAALPLSA